MTVDRMNRVLLWLLGALLLAGGVIGVLAREDVADLGLDQPGEIYDQAVETVVDDPELWWPIIIGTAVVVTLLCLFWLLRQFVRRGGRGIGTQAIERTDDGRVELDPAPLARALEADFRTLDGVRSSSVRLLSVTPVAHAMARLDLERGADPHVVRREAEDVLERLRSAVGAQGVDADLRLVMATAELPRVR